jgi:hypothetical protein
MQPYEPPAGGGEVEQYRPEGRSVRMLRDWADAATAAHRVAQSLAKTSFVPKEYRDKPAEITAAILAGFEMGFDPIQSVNAFSPIQGQAAAKARTLLAVVLSKGHEIEMVESTPTRCVMRGRRRGSENWQTVTWTIERARNLGLVQRNPEYRKQPQTMLLARASAEISRLVAPDAIMGIPFSSEELDDVAGDDATDAAPIRRRRGPVAIPRGPLVTPESIRAGDATTAAREAAERTTPDGRPPLPGETSEAGSGELSAEDDAPPAVPPVEQSGQRYTATPVDDDEAAVDTPDADPLDPAGDDPAGDATSQHGAGDALSAKDVAALRAEVLALIKERGITNRREWAGETLGDRVGSFAELDVDQLRTLRARLQDRSAESEEEST